MKSQNPVQNVAKMSIKKTKQNVANKSAERDAIKPNEGNDVKSSQEIARNAKLEELKKLLSEVTSKDMVGRHAIGVVVNDVKNTPDTYGKEAVKQLAQDLGFEKSTMYEYANVAEAWPARDFTKLCERRTGNGMPITFSHLVELIRIKNEASRAKLLEKVFEDSLSVRALREDTNEGTTKSSKKRAAVPILATMISAADKVIEIQSRWTSSLQEIREFPSTTELAAQLADVVAKNEALCTATLKTGELLETEWRRVKAELDASVGVQPSQLSSGSKVRSERRSE